MPLQFFVGNELSDKFIALLPDIPVLDADKIVSVNYDRRNGAAPALMINDRELQISYISLVAFLSRISRTFTMSWFMMIGFCKKDILFS